ncbi:MAG TPA: hypothetical protein DCY97_16590 [Marinilabiliales bacterium]|nr:hypothetical protein [Marinilabiliales bacterium]
MKRIEQIEIHGVRFYLEEGAYKKVSAFIEKMKIHFASSANGAEQLADFEKHLAEMLQNHQQTKDQIIDLETINTIITQVDDFNSFNIYESQTSFPVHKRLYRDIDHNKLGGVCSGLGAYFQIDPVILRVAFILLIFLFAGIPFLVYFLFWIIVPAAITPEEKAELFGPPIYGTNTTWRRQQNQNPDQSSTSGSLAEVFYILGRVIVILMGIFMLFVGIVLLIGFLSTAAFGGALFGGFHLGFHNFLPILNAAHFSPLVWVCITLAFIAPIFVLFYLGIKMMIPFQAKDGMLWLVVAIIWILSVVGLIGLALEDEKSSKPFHSGEEAFLIQSVNEENPWYIPLKKQKNAQFTQPGAAIFIGKP